MERLIEKLLPYISLILATSLSLFEIKLFKTDDVFTWIIIALFWFAVIAMVPIIYIKGEIAEIQRTKAEMEIIKKEIDLNNKIINFYENLRKNEK